MVEEFDAVKVPVLRGRLGHKACHAYHGGFVQSLTRDLKADVTAVVEAAGGATMPEPVPSAA